MKLVSRAFGAYINNCYPNGGIEKTNLNILERTSLADWIESESSYILSKARQVARVFSKFTNINTFITSYLWNMKNK